jgi:hypothetical protein
LFRDISKWLREMMANLEKTGALKRWEAALNAWAAKWKKIIRDILQGDDATRNAAFKTMGAELGKGFAWAVDKMVEQLIARVPDIMNALVAAIPGAIAGALKQAAQRPSNFIAGIPGAQPLADRLIGLPTVSSGTKSLSGEMLREQRRTREAVEQQTEKLPAT